MRIRAIAMVTLWAALTAAQKPKKAPPESALDQTLRQIADAQGNERQAVLPGSLFTQTSLLSDLTSDLRARRVGDVVTILVQEKASAVSTGTLKTARTANVAASVTAAGGVTRPLGSLANLAKAASNQSLDGQGTTTRDTVLTATISAVVTQVLPNGSLVIQGTKNVKINSENQVLGLRGIVRPVDVNTSNMVSSDRVAQMELQVNGKGVVADSVRRPFILYRLILGLLPF